MITGMHGMLFSDSTGELRTFLLDTLGVPGQAYGDWVSFRPGTCEMGVHPAKDSGAEHNEHHISFVCKDISAFVESLKTKGVEFDGDLRNEGFGMMTNALAPGGLKIMLYEPKH